MASSWRRINLNTNFSRIRLTYNGIYKNTLYASPIDRFLRHFFAVTRNIFFTLALTFATIVNAQDERADTFEELGESTVFDPKSLRHPVLHSTLNDNGTQGHHHTNLSVISNPYAMLNSKSGSESATDPRVNSEPEIPTRAATDCWLTKQPVGAQPYQPPPVFCNMMNTGSGTAHKEVNAWVDDFDHGLSFATFENTEYQVYEAMGNVYASMHWRHADYWMIDLAPYAEDQKTEGIQGGAIIRPDHSFRFENGKLTIEVDVSAAILAYGSQAWPEIIVTTADHPSEFRIGGGPNASDLFPGSWTLGCRLPSNRFPNVVLMDNTDNGTIHGGRIWKMSWFQQVGSETFGGSLFNGNGNYWRVCKESDSDALCRDQFRLELTPTSLSLYVNGSKYFEQKGIPPLPDEFINGDIYVYFASMMSGHPADTIRYHWDRIAINSTPPIPIESESILEEEYSISYIAEPVPKSRASIFPIKLTGKTPQEQTVTLYVHKPEKVQQAILHMRVFDPDAADEGALYINGHGPLTLFGERSNWCYDKRIVNLEYSIPPDWWQDNANSLRFIHERTGGFRIDDAYVEFRE